MRPPSFLRRGCFTWLRLTIQRLLARKKMELSSLRSHSLSATPYEKLALGEMDEREISAGFEKRNILNPHNANLDIISQENTIITTQCGGCAFLQCSYYRRPGAKGYPHQTFAPLCSHMPRRVLEFVSAHQPSGYAYTKRLFLQISTHLTHP
jgi:hypothetical protein